MKHDVDIRLLEASDIEARVMVIYNKGNSADAQITGAISGPTLEGSRTLPATIPLRPSTKDAAVTAVAILPDPCFWSPEMPFLYDVSLELRRDGEVIDSEIFSIALQPKRVVKQ